MRIFRGVLNQRDQPDPHQLLPFVSAFDRWGTPGKDSVVCRDLVHQAGVLLSFVSIPEYSRFRTAISRTTMVRHLMKQMNQAFISIITFLFVEVPPRHDYVI